MRANEVVKTRSDQQFNTRASRTSRERSVGIEGALSAYDLGLYKLLRGQYRRLLSSYSTSQTTWANAKSLPASLRLLAEKSC